MALWTAPIGQVRVFLLAAGQALRGVLARRALPPMEATLTAAALLASAEAAAIASARGEVHGSRAEAVHTVIGLLMPEITRRWAVAA